MGSIDDVLNQAVSPDVLRSRKMVIKGTGAYAGMGFG